MPAHRTRVGYRCLAKTPTAQVSAAATDPHGLVYRHLLDISHWRDALGRHKRDISPDPGVPGSAFDAIDLVASIFGWDADDQVGTVALSRYVAATTVEQLDWFVTLIVLAMPFFASGGLFIAAGVIARSEEQGS